MKIRKRPMLPYSKRIALVANRRTIIASRAQAHIVYPYTIFGLGVDQQMLDLDSWYMNNCGGVGGKPGPCPTGRKPPVRASTKPTAKVPPVIKTETAKTGKVTDATKAKFVGKVVGKNEHVHADSVETEIATAVNGKVANKEGGKYAPRDVQAGNHAIEVKSLLKGEKQGITVHEDALIRKVDYMATRPREVFHTVVADERHNYEGGAHAENYSGHRLYYKRGSGRYSLSQMHQVKDHAELKRLLNTPDDKLPEKARGSLPSGEALVKLREQAARASIARRTKDKAYKARIKGEKKAATE